MDIATASAALFCGILAATIALAVTNRAFPEFSRRERERRAAAERGRRERRRASSGKGLLGAAGALERILPVKADDAAEYRDELARAGLRMAPETWHGVQLLSTVAVGGGGTALALAAAPDAATAAALAALSWAAGWFGPKMILKGLAGSRTEEIEAELPSALEILALSVKAGYTLPNAVKLVGRTAEGELAEEFAKVDSDINMLGMDPSRALRRMSARCGSGAVGAFTAAVSAAEKQGTGIARILGSQAKIARDERFSEIMKRINSLSNRMTPIIILVFIPILIAIVVVPGAVNVVAQLGGFA